MVPATSGPERLSASGQPEQPLALQTCTASWYVPTIPMVAGRIRDRVPAQVECAAGAI